jgi:hypothetical protein
MMTDLKATKPDQRDAAAIASESKPLDPDDPMEIKAAVIAGDERLMMECLIEEFAHLGWSAKKITGMFHQPGFLATHGLEQRFGRQAVVDCIEHTLARCGVFHFEMKKTSTQIDEAVSPGRSVTVETRFTRNVES